MKPWKRLPSVLFEARRNLLRWGHGDEAVESWERELGLGKSLRLQWGHGDEAVEEITARQHAKIVLQWGHGDEPWKTCPSTITAETLPYFNGATAMKPWKRRTRSGPREPTSRTSMGPRR